MTKKIPDLALAMALMILIFLPHTAVHALTLSGARINSAINQPLNVTIELLSATSMELDSVNAYVSRIKNASAGREDALNLTVKLVRMEKGNSYLKISSKENFRMPVLNFLLDLAWSAGRIQREYTLLLNLPN